MISPGLVCPKQVDAVLAYLAEQPVINTLLLADIEKYGINSPFQQVWAQWEGNRPTAVYLRFYQNLLLYSDCREISADFVRRCTEQFRILVIMGDEASMVGLSPQSWTTPWRFQRKGLYALSDTEKLLPSDQHFRIAELSDVDAIYEFLSQIEGFGAMYASKRMIRDRIGSGGGLHLLYERDGKILSHANSTVSTEQSVVLGGIATCREERGHGYASGLVSQLSRKMLAEGRKPSLFTTAAADQNLFVALGFERIGNWDTLERQAPGCK